MNIMTQGVSNIFSVLHVCDTKMAAGSTEAHFWWAELQPK